MVVVKKSPGESDDSLIRKFSRKVMSVGSFRRQKGENFISSHRWLESKKLRMQEG